MNMKKAALQEDLCAAFLCVRALGNRGRLVSMIPSVP